MELQEQEALKDIYEIVGKQLKQNEAIYSLIGIMLNKESDNSKADVIEQPKQEINNSITDTKLRDFIKEQLLSYDLPIEEEFINGIYKYANKGNLSKDQIAEQLEKIFLANKKAPKQDIYKYTYGCFNNLTKKE